LAGLESVSCAQLGGIDDPISALNAWEYKDESFVNPKLNQLTRRCLVLQASFDSLDEEFVSGNDLIRRTHRFTVISINDANCRGLVIQKPINHPESLAFEVVHVGSSFWCIPDTTTGTKVYSG